MDAVDLLERERELAELDALLLEAKAGEARVALLEGPPGIGKTRLIAELRARAERSGIRVLVARGSELEREFPFGVVRQLFEPALEDASFAGAAEGARTVFASPGDAGGGGGDASFATLHGLYWMALNLAERTPLLLVVDDLHWADRASLRFLTYLVRRFEGVPLLLALGLRAGEPGTDPGLIAELAHDPATVPVHPGPLSMRGIDALVREVLGSEPHRFFSEACAESTSGNPLLLRQLLTALQAEGIEPHAEQARVVREIGPRAISRTVALRLARLSPEARTVARTVAILGDDAALHVAARLAELDERPAAEATGELARAEILRHGSPLGFVHPLVRDCVYREIAPGERELLHARAAELLEQLGAPIEQVAAQLLMTPPRGDARTAELLQEAGRTAIRKGAADSAPNYLRRALAEPPTGEQRPQLLFELGIAEILTDGESSRQHLREAYETLTDPVTKAISAAVLGRVVMFRGDPPAAGELARRAIAELSPEHEDLKRALKAFEYCTDFFGAVDWERLPRIEAEPPAPDAPIGVKMLAAVAAVYRCYTGGSADECAELALASRAGGDLVRADNGLVGIAGIRPLVIADREEAVPAWREALAEAHRRGSVFELAGLHLWYGFTQYWRGELADAEATLRMAWDELRQWGFTGNADWYCGGFLTVTLIGRGKLAEAHKALARAPDPGDHPSDGARTWHHARTALALAEGRYEDAIATAEYCGRVYGAIPNPADSPWRTFKAYALHRLGRDAEAQELALEELELARAWGAPGTVGRSLRTVGRVRGEAGLEQLEEAVAVLEPSTARLEHARAVAALGTLLRHHRKPSVAREPLQRALDLATQCDAGLLAEEVRAELAAAGVRQAAGTTGGVDALTPSERRVVDMALAGGTNRDIAQELYVTPKTVEVHLSNAYRKLGIRGRRDLPRVLAAG